MKAHKRIHTSALQEATALLVQMHPAKVESSQSKYLICPSTDGLHRVRISTISHCQAEGNYARIFYNGGQSILLSKALRCLDEVLPKELFIRVHQSYLVARSGIERISSKAVVLDSGVEIPMARARRQQVKEAFLTQGLRIS